MSDAVFLSKVTFIVLVSAWVTVAELSMNGQFSTSPAHTFGDSRLMLITPSAQCRAEFLEGLILLVGSSANNTFATSWPFYPLGSQSLSVVV